jgi:ribosomal protein S18 acetylase RimI-like enzyme
MNHSFPLRLATVEDAVQVSHQRHAMFTDMGHTDIEVATEKFAEWVRPKLAGGDYLGWFALEGEMVIGGAGLWLIEWPPTPLDLHTQRGYICNVYVEPEFRRQGVARLLVSAILEHCEAKGIHVILLHASQKGRSLYEELGFSATNEMRRVHF